MNRIHSRKSSGKDRLFDRTTSADQSTTSNFIVDVNDDTTSRQGVLVTKVKRTDVQSVASDSVELKDIETERKRSAVSSRHASVRITRLSQLPSIIENDAIQRNKSAVNTERIKSVKVDRVKK